MMFEFTTNVDSNNFSSKGYDAVFADDPSTRFPDLKK